MEELEELVNKMITYTKDCNELSILEKKFILLFNKLDNYEQHVIVAYIFDKAITEDDMALCFENILKKISFMNIANNIAHNQQKIINYSMYDYKDIGCSVKYKDYVFKVCERKNGKLFDKHNNDYKEDDCKTLSKSELRQLKIDNILDNGEF